jgi:uncharacterized membrane protein
MNMKNYKTSIIKALGAAFALALFVIPSSVALADTKGGGIGTAGFGSDWEAIGSYTDYTPY